MSKEVGQSFEPSGKTKWQGRRPKGQQCTNSYKEFKEKARHTVHGRAHLDAHHKGWGKDES